MYIFLSNNITAYTQYSMVLLHKTINVHYLRKHNYNKNETTNTELRKCDHINKANEDVYTHAQQFSRDDPIVLDRNCGMCRIRIKISTYKYTKLCHQTGHNEKFLFVHSNRLSIYNKHSFGIYALCANVILFLRPWLNFEAKKFLLPASSRVLIFSRAGVKVHDDGIFRK